MVKNTNDFNEIDILKKTLEQLKSPWEFQGNEKSVKVETSIIEDINYNFLGIINDFYFIESLDKLEEFEKQDSDIILTLERISNHHNFLLFLKYFYQTELKNYLDYLININPKTKEISLNFYAFKNVSEVWNFLLSKSKIDKYPLKLLVLIELYKNLLNSNEDKESTDIVFFSDEYTVTNINNNLRTWSIKDDEIRNNIQSRFEIFKSVTVQSKLPSTIKVKVEEYSFIAQNKKDDGSLEIIMENGKPYSGKVRNNYNLPILENFKDDSSKLDEVYKNLNKLKEDVRLQISEIINDEGDNVTIYMKDGQKVKALRASFSDKLNYYNEISKYIEDKNNTTLNLINGAYLETTKTEKRRDENIKQLLSRQGLKDDSTSKTDKEKVDDTEKVEKNNKAENSTTNSKVTSSTNNKNTKQQSVTNNKNE